MEINSQMEMKTRGTFHHSKLMRHKKQDQRYLKLRNGSESTQRVMLFSVFCSS